MLFLSSDISDVSTLYCWLVVTSPGIVRRGDHCECYHWDHSPSQNWALPHSWHNGVTIRHRVAADNTDNITALAAWSCVTSTRTHARITAWVYVLCTAGFLLCVKTRNVLPRTMNQVLYEGKSFFSFSFPDNRIEIGKLLTSVLTVIAV